jgi:hypothetical protein
MPFIIYPQANNKLAVLIPAPCDLTLEEIAAKDVPAETPYAIVDSLESVDNDYFDGFIYSEGEAVADIAACKSIHLNKFRSARAPKLSALDVAFMRAVEQSDSAKQSEIAEAKQELRDVTKVELPETLEEIKAVWPDILN